MRSKFSSCFSSPSSPLHFVVTSYFLSCCFSFSQLLPPPFSVPHTSLLFCFKLSCFILAQVNLHASCPAHLQSHSPAFMSSWMTLDGNLAASSDDPTEICWALTHLHDFFVQLQLGMQAHP
mmetsp:Transcript_33998/g.106545  ORF Transcript_33998/g.106545 Transcript_33998/m.106545 type:complete len:121 (-) Transcript_33998:540-902(-)